jgi:hypothetical protein
MISIEKMLVFVVISNVAWFLVGWSAGFKQGVKDGFNRGRAAGLRWATDRVRNS